VHVVGTLEDAAGSRSAANPAGAGVRP
jgi:hypothetical protein